MSVDEKKKSNQLQNGDDEWLKARSKILQDLCKLVNCKINKLMGGLNVDRDDNQASANLIYLMVKVRTQVKMNVWVRQYVGSYRNEKKKMSKNIA